MDAHTLILLRQFDEARQRLEGLVGEDAQDYVGRKAQSQLDSWDRLMKKAARE